MISSINTNAVGRPLWTYCIGRCRLHHFLRFAVNPHEASQPGYSFTIT